MNTTKKVSIAIVTSVALIIGIYKWYQPTGNVGVYGNKVSTYITTESGRKAEVAWLKSKGFNSYCGYGISSYVTSNPNAVRDFNLKMRRAGIKEIGYIYSSTSFMTALENFQKNCTNDSMKFSFVVSEIEQYNTGDRTGFYNALRTVSAFCKKNGLKSYVYQGWPTQQDCDTIVKYSDRIYLHAYGQFDKQANVGAWCYGYQKSRLTMLANSMNKLYPNTSLKYSHSLLTSNEQPDQTKTQFGYKYYQTHTFTEPLASFTSYFNANATALIKSRIEIGNTQLFVENFAK